MRVEQDQVLIAVVVDVREERLRRAVENREPGGLGDVLEGAVAVVAKEPVGQAVGLRHVQVVEAVAVGVAHRDAVVSHAAAA